MSLKKLEELEAEQDQTGQVDDYRTKAIMPVPKPARIVRKGWFYSNFNWILVGNVMVLCVLVLCYCIPTVMLSGLGILDAYVLSTMTFVFGVFFWELVTTLYWKFSSTDFLKQGRSYSQRQMVKKRNVSLMVLSKNANRPLNFFLLATLASIVLMHATDDVGWRWGFILCSNISALLIGMMLSCKSIFKT